MGNIHKDNIILLLDNYGDDSRKLHNSFKLAGKNYPVFVIDEDGFLPEDVTSVFGYFLGDFKNAENIPGKPRYFNQIRISKILVFQRRHKTAEICIPTEQKITSGVNAPQAAYR